MNSIFADHLEIIEDIKKSDLLDQIDGLVDHTINITLPSGGYVYVCGNGGSASDANHFVGELIGRFKQERKAIRAQSLCDNNVILTAVSNDYSYEDVFVRQLDGIATQQDLIICLSTSGTSKNIQKVLDFAHVNNINVALLTGEAGEDVDCDWNISVPSYDTARIQEFHIMFLHYIAEKLEESL